MTTILSDATGRRTDGRSPAELRAFMCRLGVQPHADGSAYVAMGNTRVLCAVYGPHECKHRSRILEERAIVNCQYSMATFSTTERKVSRHSHTSQLLSLIDNILMQSRPRGDRKSQEFRSHLQKTFETALLTEHYPRSQIDIFCEILQVGSF